MQRTAPSLLPPTSRRALWGLTLACALVCLPAVARAQAAEQRVLSQYERESVEMALQQVHGEREPEPEGKIVEQVLVVPLDMIDDRDPWPNFLNFFHATTRPYVVEREVLLEQGKPFRLSLADETERNLRELVQFTVVLVVPLKGSSPDSVRVMVVTKDVLSLRFNWEPRVVNGKLDYLAVSPSEQNLLGTHNAIAASLELTTHTYALGGSVSIPRIAGSRINGYLRAAAIMNCETGDLEGSSGYISYGQPLYSTRARWAWQTSMSWYESISRPTSAGGEWVCSGGVEPKVRVLTDQVEQQYVAIPDRYTYNELSGDSSVTRSFGLVDKYDITLGVEADRRSAHVHDLALDEVDFGEYVLDADGVRVDQNADGWADVEERSSTVPDRELALALDAYRRARLPVRDTRISPYVQLFAHRAQYHRVINYWTLGLQEDYSLGHYVVFKLYPALKAWGSTRNLVGTVAGLGYTWPVETGFLRLRSTSSIEFSDIEHSDASLYGAVHYVSPQLGFGRLVSDVSGTRRFLNYFNSRTSLGGTGRLRGYRPGAFYGQNYAVWNIEFRSVPFQLLSVLVGGAVFYDVGDAFDTLADFKLKEGAGAGLRLGFPQLQRSLLRIDAGFPISRNVPQGEFTVVAEFSQAVDTP